MSEEPGQDQTWTLDTCTCGPLEQLPGFKVQCNLFVFCQLSIAVFQSLEGTFKQCYFWNNSKLNRNGDPNLPVASPYFTLQRLFLSWVASFLFPVPHCTAPSTFSFHCLTLRSSNEPFPPQLSLIFCQLFALFSVLLLPFCLLSPTLLLLFLLFCQNPNFEPPITQFILYFLKVCEAPSITDNYLPAEHVVVQTGSPSGFRHLCV